MENFAVLTTTFNRDNMLSTLYDSLKLQTDKNFKWIIIDDGSTDNTELLVQDMIQENIVDIEYIYTNNGGKGRALNKGFSVDKNILLYIVVDSDDFLFPNAIESIRMCFNKYANTKNIGAFFFHYESPYGDVIKPKGKIINKDYILTPYKYNSKFGKNDGCICYLNKVLIKYRYPEYEGEKYVGPTILQLEMSDEFKILYSPLIIGVAEYQKDGLTKQGRKLRLENPMGMIHYCKLMMSKKSDFINQIKYAISIWPYAINKKLTYKKLTSIVHRPILLLLTYIPGFILNLYWNRYTD